MSSTFLSQLAPLFSNRTDKLPPFTSFGVCLDIVVCASVYILLLHDRVAGIAQHNLPLVTVYDMLDAALRGMVKGAAILHSLRHAANSTVLYPSPIMSCS